MEGNGFNDVPLILLPDKDDTLRRKNRNNDVVNNNHENDRSGGSNFFGKGPKKQKTLRERSGKSDLIKNGRQAKARKIGTESQRNIAANASEYRPITNERSERPLSRYSSKVFPMNNQGNMQ